MRPARGKTRAVFASPLVFKRIRETFCSKPSALAEKIVKTEKNDISTFFSVVGKRKGEGKRASLPLLLFLSNVFRSKCLERRALVGAQPRQDPRRLSRGPVGCPRRRPERRRGGFFVVAISGAIDLLAVAVGSCVPSAARALRRDLGHGPPDRQRVNRQVENGDGSVFESGSLSSRSIK